MLVGMWRKGNPHALTVGGMQTGSTPMENSMEVSQNKLELELPYDPAISLLGIHLKKPRTLI